MIVLWFSGGKDSMATLLLMKEQLHRITVLFANTGKNYPELLQTVEKTKSLCPLWEEVKADRDAQWKANGLPSDLVPIDWTHDGQRLSHVKQVKVQSYLQCCYQNITAPLWQRTKELGATVVIKGQRLDEAHKSTARDGDEVEGIRFIHPIEHWTRDNVLSYLRAELGELPEHYGLDHSSMDCYDCTAFAAHSHDRVAFMRDRHPDLYADYSEKLKSLHSAIAEPLKHYEALWQT